MSDTNSPPATLKTVCVETKVCRSVLSLSWPSHGVVLEILTVSLNSPSPTGSAPTSTVPSSASQLRTSAPTTSPPSSASGSSSLPAGTFISIRLGVASSASSRPSITTSRSAASSQAR